MRGTAVLMRNNTVTILENVDEVLLEKLKKQGQASFILCEDTIDWDYGY